MSNQLQHLAGQYAAVLRRYLVQPDETGLTAAYEFGRRALSSGLGLFDLATLHHGALWPAIANVGSADITLVMNRAAEFFAECLSPYEMSLRGYQEANSGLLVLNEKLQHANAAAEAANRELEAFNYSVAHDLRAPLRSIDRFSEAVLEDYVEALDSQGMAYLNRVRAAAHRMGEMIDGLLALSRLGRAELQHASTDLAEIARTVLRQLQHLAPARHVTFTCPDKVLVKCDGRLLGLVLENLLGNAWKFTAKTANPEIEFGVTCDGNERVYFVGDNGAGFDMAHAGKLFGAFQRWHSRNDFEGTGIGLATVQRIVHRHGGRVWAEARVDQGATFFWTLSDQDGS